MKLLWDSSTMTVHMSLDSGETAYEYEWQAERNLARDMLAWLRDKLAEHEATFADLSGIGVFRGPGSFTGLRIGMTVLNTLAAAQHIPIVGAIGEDWRATCLSRLAAGDDDKIVLPEYGAAALVTKPRK